jgi:heat shock protein HslJ
MCKYARFLEGKESSPVARVRKKTKHVHGALYALSLFASLIFLFFIPSKNLCSDDTIKNINVLSKWFPSGTAQLINGVYREKAGKDSATDTIVRLTDKVIYRTTGEKKIAMVILSTEPGGSGTFYDLAYLTREPEGWVNRDIYFLGDRVRVNFLWWKDDVIRIRMATHGPDDPMCCPTKEVEEAFRVEADRIVKAGSFPMAPESARLMGVEWRWQGSQYSNDTQNIPPGMDRYTLTLQPDGRVNIRADCNRGGGNFALDGNKIAITITHTTRAACPPDSLEQPYIRDLNGVAVWFFKEGDLYLDIKYDTGTMKFSK